MLEIRSAKLRKIFKTAFIHIMFVYGTAKKDKFSPDGSLLGSFGTMLPSVV